LGLIARQVSATDRRVREVVVTEAGKAMSDRIDVARQRMSEEIFKTWTEQDIFDLARLMSRFARAFREDGQSAS
jgi:DNA-binding MarR family transcriptional regulator